MTVENGVQGESRENGGGAASAGQRDDLIVWVDLEMTGLDPETCVIVQAAMIITDRDLKEVADPVEVTVWQPPAALSSMVPFVRRMHKKSGLLPEIESSLVDIEQAEQQLLAVLTALASFRTARLAGNSIWQDRRFLHRYMPAFEAYLHHRMVDVSSFKEIADWWYGARHDKGEGAAHTALYDIRQSIAEMRYYREQILR